MRLLFPLALALGPALASLAPPAVAASDAHEHDAAQQCRDASKQFARKGGVWRHDPVKPRKLAELPPADSYAAVYRLDERGCMVPVKYRDVRR
jgi:hypothetical protein